MTVVRQHEPRTTDNETIYRAKTLHYSELR